MDVQRQLEEARQQATTLADVVDAVNRLHRSILWIFLGIPIIAWILISMAANS